ncbi:MAG: RHS repeat protein [Zoogloea sp.]|nr:RHS repeat protein [Zoogloea sp.]
MRSTVGQSIKVGSIILGLVAAVCAVSAHAGSASYTYDTLGRLTQVSYSNGTVIAYSYDAAGNRSTVVVSGAP